MSETRRYQAILLSIQDRIKALGSSNRTRWASLSMTQNLGFKEFIDKLRFLGNVSPEEDVRKIWDAIGISGDSMRFIDFINLMQYDADELRINPSHTPRQTFNEEPRYESSTPSYSQKQSFVDNSRYDAPAQSYGRNEEHSSSPRNHFVSIKRYIKEIVVDCMAADYDTSGEIPIKTFTEVCSKFGIEAYDPDFLSIVRQNDPGNTGYVSYFLLAAQVCQLESTPLPRSEPVQSQRRMSFDAPSYTNEPSYTTSTNNNAISASGRRMSPSELASYIAQVAYDKLNSVRNAYNTWKGYSDVLTSEKLYEGLKKYGNLDISFSDVDNLVRSYGDALNLNSFVRMLSASPTPNASAQSSTLSNIPNRKMTADEETIYQLASQIREPGWENIIMKSRSTDEMIQGFRQMGVQIDENRLGVITSKLGRSGLVDTLRTKVQ